MSLIYEGINMKKKCKIIIKMKLKGKYRSKGEGEYKDVDIIYSKLELGKGKRLDINELTIEKRKDDIYYVYCLNR